jgi:DNA invertase Pin-like site-specific DNA recombinase
MRVFGYMRVSSEGQVDGDGFFRQKEAIEEFCRVHGLTLTGLVREEGVSGTLEDRPALTNLLADDPDVIIIERMDRLARDLMVQELLIREMVKSGIKLYSADQGGLIDIADDTADPTRKMIRQICGAFAEFEKSSLVLKLKKARIRTRLLKGRCEGRLPFGHSPERPEEKRICQTVLAHRAMGGTYRMILLAVRAVHGKSLSMGTITSILRRHGAL